MSDSQVKWWSGFLYAFGGAMLTFVDWRITLGAFALLYAHNLSERHWG